MIVEIRVPDVGENVTQVTLTRWLKEVGATVKAGEAVAEVMTDKAAFDVESDVDGVLIEVLVTPDEEVAAAAILGRIKTIKTDV